MAKLKITQVRSIINRSAKQRGTLEALGIKRMNHSSIQEDNAVIRGMVQKVIHLVKVEEIEG